MEDWQHMNDTGHREKGSAVRGRRVHPGHPCNSTFVFGGEGSGEGGNTRRSSETLVVGTRKRCTGTAGVRYRSMERWPEVVPGLRAELRRAREHELREEECGALGSPGHTGSYSRLSPRLWRGRGAERTGLKWHPDAPGFVRAGSVWTEVPRQCQERAGWRKARVAVRRSTDAAACVLAGRVRRDHLSPVVIWVSRRDSFSNQPPLERCPV